MPANQRVQGEHDREEENSEVEFGTDSETESSGAESTEEEDPEERLEEEKAIQATEEEKVKAAAEELGRKQRRVGDLRGKWNLYSSEWVENFVNEKGGDLNDNNWESGVGTIEFGKHLIEEADAPYAGDMGMVLNIEGGPIDALAVRFNKPKYASVDPETVHLYDEGDENQISVEINFLGNGYLEMRMDDVYFAGMQFQGRQGVKRAAEEADIEWRNCKYIGHLHPANNKRLKTMLAQYGGPVDFEGSDSGSFDESDATESEDGSQGEDGDEGEDEEEEDEDKE